MAALVLGLLIASAKTSYDNQSNALTEMSAKIILLDRILAHYGPGETRQIRDSLQKNAMPTAFLVVLVLWLTFMFGTYGLFARPNATVLVTLFLCALSVSAAIFLILELYRPFQGVIQISSAPLRYALAHLGQ